MRPDGTATGGREGSTDGEEPVFAVRVVVEAVPNDARLPGLLAVETTLADAGRVAAEVALAWANRPAEPEPPAVATGARPKVVISLVAEAFGLEPADLTGTGRSRRVVTARHAAMYALRLGHPDMSSVEIGRLMSKDHSTVLHALAKMESEADKRPWLISKIAWALERAAEIESKAAAQ